jgi:putative GTP pyrophosphokinase
MPPPDTLLATMPRSPDPKSKARSSTMSAAGTTGKRKATKGTKGLRGKQPSVALGSAAVEAWYDDRTTTHRVLLEKAQQVLTEQLKHFLVQHLAVHGRLKEKNSLVTKAHKKGYTNLDLEVTDLAGLRVLVLRERDVDDACAVIDEVFHVHRTMSGDKGDELGDDRFGYRSVHRVCDLGKARRRTPDEEAIRGLRFEIQVRTLAQHTWAEIEHEHIYKNEGRLPARAKRTFSRIAALFEAADTELDRLCDEIAEFQKDSASNAKNKTPLDAVLLARAIEQTAAFHSVPLQAATRDKGADATVVNEAKALGYAKVDDIKRLLPDALMHAARAKSDEFGVQTWIGLARLGLIYNDLERYFDVAWKRSWRGLSALSYEVLCTRYPRSKVDDVLKRFAVNPPPDDDSIVLRMEPGPDDDDLERIERESRRHR